MGLAIAPLGFYYGFISTAMGILLRAHGVSVGRIAGVSAIAFSPTFWAFLLCPILDVRFSKRAYAIFFAAVAAVCLGVSTLLTANLTAFTAVLTVRLRRDGHLRNAHQGWMPDVIDDTHYSHVGRDQQHRQPWRGGRLRRADHLLVRHLSPVPTAMLLGLAVMAPTVMLFFIPLPAAPVRGVAEVFSSFFRDLWLVCSGATASLA